MSDWSRNEKLALRVKCVSQNANCDRLKTEDSEMYDQKDEKKRKKAGIKKK